MRRCSECGEPYDVTTSICEKCGKELPAPYEDVDADGVKDEGMEELGNAYPDGTNPPEPDSVLSAYGVTGSWQLFRQSIPPVQLTLLAGATVYLGDAVIEHGTVVVAEGRIIEVFDGLVPDPQDGSTYYDLSGMVLAPGFIDLHTHGMAGIDTNKATVSDFMRWSMEAVKHGMTSVCPTAVACSPVELRSILTNLRSLRQSGHPGAHLLGLHYESNFLSMDFKGAQPPDSIFSPDDHRAAQVLDVLDEFAEDVRIVTLAPELPGALELIQWLTDRDIIVSLGHSSATYDQAIAGFDAGATHATHLFNAMPPLHHRNPGLVGAALERDDVFTEMVCDGVHIHPAVIATAITAKGAERFMPVSDSLEGAGLPSGSEFFLGGQHVTIMDNVARLDSGTIAGSITTMNGILHLLVERVGWDLAESLTMLSTTPADGLEMKLIGRIARGAFADLVALDDGLNVKLTMAGGKVVYQAE